jgi:hypothetical protein
MLVDSTYIDGINVRIDVEPCVGGQVLYVTPFRHRNTRARWYEDYDYLDEMYEHVFRRFYDDPPVTNDQVMAKISELSFNPDTRRFEDHRDRAERKLDHRGRTLHLLFMALRTSPLNGNPVLTHLFDYLGVVWGDELWSCIALSNF